MEYGEEPRGAQVEERSHSAEYRVLCICGLSPQVVTETLSVLLAEERGAPIDVHVLTTAIGAERLQETLLASGDGWLAKLFQAYGLPPLREDALHLHVIADAAGAPLADIVSPNDNVAVADLVNGLVRDLTTDSMPALHLSIAGGRKTMSFYAAYALSLHGRAQDELSHILVDPELEHRNDFFFASRQAMETGTPPVRLARLPFVHMRRGLDGAWRRGERSFSETVTGTELLLMPPSVQIDVAERGVRLSDRPVTLSPRNFLLLYWFADRAARDLGPIACDEAALEEIEARRIEVEGAGPSRLGDGLQRAREDLRTEGRAAWFERGLTGLKKALRSAPELPPGVGGRYCIKRSGRKGYSRYALEVPAKSIEIHRE